MRELHPDKGSVMPCYTPMAVRLKMLLLVCCLKGPFTGGPAATERFHEVP